MEFTNESTKIRRFNYDVFDVAQKCSCVTNGV